MRTTIEMDDKHRASLLELAARRGEKGFSSLVREAIDGLPAVDGAGASATQAGPTDSWCAVSERGNRSPPPRRSCAQLETLIIADTMKSQWKTKTVPALEARRQLGRLMQEIRGGARVLVEKFGIPMIGMISEEEFQRLVAEREARFEMVERIRRRLPAVGDSDVQRDVVGALKEVRRRRRA